MAIPIGERCGFYPGTLVVAAIFGPTFLRLPTAFVMVPIGAVWKKRGLFETVRKSKETHRASLVLCASRSIQHKYALSRQ